MRVNSLRIRIGSNIRLHNSQPIKRKQSNKIGIPGVVNDGLD